MKKLILSTVLLLLASTSAFADIDPIKDDLSGAWRLSCKPEMGVGPIEFFATKTSIKANYVERASVVYSILFQDLGSFDGQDYSFPYFAFAVTTLKGEGYEGHNEDYNTIVWYQNQRYLDKKGSFLEDEGILILGVEGDTLILGGDFETEENCRLTKLPGFGPIGN